MFLQEKSIGTLDGADLQSVTQLCNNCLFLTKKLSTKYKATDIDPAYFLTVTHTTLLPHKNFPTYFFL